MTGRGFLGHGGDLWRLTGADFVLRTAYQMGKTPLLPLYAAALGASDLMIGTVLSVSTLTGLMLKPLFGLLSDRGGRRLWLLIGLTLFATIPFLYRFVETPEELFALRLVHGTATAIFGPVGLAYIAEMGIERRGERLGIYGMARSGGYFLAPTLAALLLTVLPPEQVFTIIGFLSLAAALPLAGLSSHRPATRPAFRPALAEGLRAIGASAAFRLAALLELAVHIATYAVKAFLPIFALTAMEVDLIVVGLFFSAQELAHTLLRPVGGRMSDRYGAVGTISLGLLILAAALTGLAFADSGFSLFPAAIGIGISLGLILPSTAALFAGEMPAPTLGLGMGALGALRNLGKVVGPVAAGALLAYVDHGQLFMLTALFVLAAAALLATSGPGRGLSLRRGRP
ncbi:MAG: MFS transporter [Pseudomonadota bacterium]